MFFQIVFILIFLFKIIELQAYAKMWADSYNAQKPPKRVDFVQVNMHIILSYTKVVYALNTHAIHANTFSQKKLKIYPK